MKKRLKKLIILALGTAILSVTFIVHQNTKRYDLLYHYEKESQYTEASIDIDLISRKIQKFEPFDISTMIIGEMMNEETIKKANTYRNREDGLEAFHKWEIWEFNHREEIEQSAYFTHESIFSYETMKTSKHTYGTSIGQCYDFAIYNIALLRLMGLEAEKSFMILAPNHAYALFKYKNQSYLFDNNELYLKDDDGGYRPLISNGNRIQISDEEHSNIICVANDLYYFPSRTKESVTSKSFIKEYTQYLSFNLDDINNQSSQDIMSLQFAEHKDLNPIKVYEAIYALSELAPSSQYTQAKYMAQSLIVKYPNLYLKAFKKQVAVDQVISEHNLKSINSIFDYVHNNIKSNPTCHEDYKLYSPLQMELGKEGNDYDRATYASILLSSIAIDNDLILTTTNKAYIYIEKTNKLYDVSDFSEVDRYNGEILIMFSEDEVYYPKLELNTYSDNNSIWRKINDL